MRLIRQRLKTDCGIACAAMLAGTTYEQAAAAFDKRGRTNEEAMVRAMKKLGLKVQPMSSGPANNHNALLKCNQTTRRRAGVKNWHWCVWFAAEKRILDPLDDGVDRPVLSHINATKI